VHGQETEGLTGLVNLIEVLKRGTDLRGRPQPRLHALGRQCRVLVIPTGNPDGVARFVPQSLHSMTVDDIRFWGQGTWSDGSFCDWPACKARHPMRGADVGFLGCYFDDAGVNPMHDEFMHPLGSEAPAILQIAETEAPDFAVSLHSHAQPPALLRPAFVPIETQDRVRALAVQTYQRLADRGLPHGRPFDPQPEKGPRLAPFNLTSALHHISGATVFTFECPHGTVDDGACQVTPDQILDIQLTLYESMLEHALEARAACATDRL
jgi:hypothetical protein